jgi:hypothetical protein
MSEAIPYLLSKLDLYPILVDIGASGAPPNMWERIARHSIYVGFDPDLRETREVSDGRFYKAYIINKAVTTDREKEKVQFYFTNSPYCSSTLRPDSESLASFLFSDLFTVERESTVPATTLDSVINQLSLSRIDWFKTDSQGTDLRLFKSLKDSVRARVLAVDIEPGLIDAYVGEDLFVDAHRYLTQNGFWLSNLDVQGAVRMRKSTLNEIMATNKDLNRAYIETTVKKTPGWCEARYLKTLEAVTKQSFAENDYVILWIFAMIDNQHGFALDLAIEYKNVFGRDEISQLMKDEPISCIVKSGHSGGLYTKLKPILPSKLKQWLKQNVL